jgi:MFS family permease
MMSQPGQTGRRESPEIAWFLKTVRPRLAGVSQPTPQTDYPENIDAAVLKIAGVVVLGAIMSILDITVVNVALPTFQQEFSDGGKEIAYSHVAWAVTAYTLALATVIPMTGWAADRFGTKRLYLLAIFLFTSGSALCATATDINMLIGFRVLQGLGGGMLMPLGMTIMTKAAGPHRMGRVMAILGVPMLLGPILGPIIGAQYVERGIVDAASSFAQTYWVAWVLVALTLIPALLLPRKREATHFLDDEGLPPVVVH